MNMLLMVNFQLKNINSYFSDIYPIFPNNLRFYPLALLRRAITQASLKIHIGCLHQTGGFWGLPIEGVIQTSPGRTLIVMVTILHWNYLR